MEVVKLNTLWSTDTLIEGYSSMVWTERFLEAGEFVLKTSRIAETRAKLPTGSLLGLRDSKEVMWVENSEIGVDTEGKPELTVSGRTFEVFLNHRDTDTNLPNHNDWQSLHALPDNWFLPGAWAANGALTYRPSVAAEYLLWIGNVGTLPFPPIGVIGAGQQIPNLLVTESLDDTNAGIRWAMTNGNRYEKILEILGKGNLGIRNVRPPHTNVTVMSFDDPDIPGKAVRVVRDAPTALTWDVYKGTDRTANVEFTYYDDITNYSYLSSNKDYKNVAKVFAPIGKAIIPAPRYGSVPPEGLERREIFVDASDLTNIDANTTAAEMLQERGLRELRKHYKRAFFNGEIAPYSKSKYKVDYDLGDLVTVTGEYGISETMFVSEYVRTEDADGDRSYPTLIRPE